MSSILTNAGAMTALQTLKTINKDLATTQNRISTGMRVAEASDNAAYWSIATTMRSDNNANSVVQDALGLGAGRLDTAYTGVNSAIEIVDQIKEKLISALGASGDDKGKIQTEIAQLQGQLESIVDSANYAGSNLLSGDGYDSATEMEIVSSYNRGADGEITIGKIEVTLADILLYDGSAGALSDVIGITGLGSATDAAIEGFLENVEEALTAMTDAASTLGAAKTRVDIQSTFVGNLMDAIDRGVGQLVDADMEEESTRLQALQTQQQLGIQALSIANANSQNILALFR